MFGACPEIKKYKRCIADLKAAKAKDVPEDKIPRDAMPIGEIIDMMETANQAIGRAAKTAVRPIRDHLGYMLGKGIAFDDRRFEHLFGDRNVSGLVQESSAYEKIKRRLDYGYREKMAGFVTKSGALEWEEDKIDGFVEAIQKSSTKE